MKLNKIIICLSILIFSNFVSANPFKKYFLNNMQKFGMGTAALMAIDTISEPSRERDPYIMVGLYFTCKYGLRSLKSFAFMNDFKRNPKQFEHLMKKNKFENWLKKNKF